MRNRVFKPTYLSKIGLLSTLSITLMACVDMGSGSAQNIVDDKDRSVLGHYVLVDESAVALDCRWGAMECNTFTFGWRKQLFIAAEGEEKLRVSQIEIGGNAVDESVFDVGSRELALQEGGRRLLFRNESYLKFVDLQSGDLSMANSRWSIEVPAQGCDEPDLRETWTASVNLSRGSMLPEPARELYINTTGRGLSCFMHSMVFREDTLRKESVRRISTNKQWLWLSEGFYKRVN